MQIPLGELDEVKTYHLLCQTVLPRPIAWVLTSDRSSGRLNLAPFSFFAPLASDPPLLGFSVGNRLGRREKDTAVNATIGSSLVVHIPHRASHRSVQASAAPHPREVSELDDPEVDGELDASWSFPLPRLAAASVAFGGTVARRVELTDFPGAQILVLVHVDIAWVRDDAASVDDRGRTVIDPTAIDPLSRLGAGRFAATAPI